MNERHLDVSGFSDKDQQYTLPYSQRGKSIVERFLLGVDRLIQSL